MKKICRILAAIILGILLFILGLEAYLRLANFDDSDSMKVFELPIYESSLVMSWKHKLDQNFEKYYGEDLVFNSLGYRGAEPQVDKDAVWMLGDDFTFGREMAESKTFVSKLNFESDLDYWNMAVNGYSMPQYAAFLNQNLFLNQPEKKPELVVLNLFVGDDFSDLDQFKLLTESDQLPELLVHKNLFVGPEGYLRQVDFEQVVSMAWQEVERQVFGKVEQSGRADWSEFLPVKNELRNPEIDANLAQSRRYLTTINSMLQQLDIDFLVVLIPMDVQVSRDYWKRYDNLPFDSQIMNDNLPQRGLKTFMENEEILYLDLLPHFRDAENKDDLYLRSSIYLSEQGHELVAEKIGGMVDNE